MGYCNLTARYRYCYEGKGGNDFSKIQGRFNTRLSLSSANVDEVIKRRILYKNETAKETLKLYYADKEAIIKKILLPFPLIHRK